MAGTPRKAAPAQEAQKAEVNETAPAVEEDQRFVMYKDVKYLVPGPLDVSVDLLEADGELDVVKSVLGDEQYAAWRATKPTLRELRSFGDELVKAVGFDDLGN
jgi:hypothetical protein